MKVLLALAVLSLGIVGCGSSADDGTPPAKEGTVPIVQPTAPPPGPAGSGGGNAMPAGDGR